MLEIMRIYLLQSYILSVKVTTIYAIILSSILEMILRCT